MRAVIADVAPDRSRALEDELVRHGHDVTRVTTGAELLAAGAAAELIVVGRRVGADDGLDLTRALRAGPGGERALIVLVGTTDELDPVAALAAGASDAWVLDAAAPDGVAVRLALAEHHARLQAESVRLGGELSLLREALDESGTAFVLTDPGLEDHPVVYANRAFYELTGYSPDEVLGRNCRVLQGPATQPGKVALMREAIAAERPVTVEIVNHRKDGTPFRNEVRIAPVRDGHGAVVRFVGVQVDVSAYRPQGPGFANEQRARRSAEAAERRSTFLADASPLLDAHLDLRATLESLARLTVPHLADVCLVDVLEGGEVRRLAGAADEAAVERELRRLPRSYPFAHDDPVARVVRSGVAEVLEGEPATVFGGHGGTLAGRQPRGAMLVPLTARGRTIGVLALATLDPGRTFSADDLALAQDLARRAALALDNARLFEEQSAVARVLQASLLPERLPRIDGIDLAAAYRPAGDGTEIGGDFYDAFPSAGGGMALTIGDVTGKGAGAAALTGLTRHTLRTAAMYERAPSGILATLNRALLAQRARRGKYCTVAVARLETIDGHVEADVACAGHPLPLVLRARGDVEAVGRPGTVLGYVPDPRLHDTRVRLAPGDALVLYTDGITEARTRTGLLGDERLAALVRGCAGLGAGAIAGRLEHAAIASQQGRPRDDVAIAVARVRC